MRLAKEGYFLKVYKKYSKYATYLIEGKMPEKEESEEEESKDKDGLEYQKVDTGKDDFGLVVKRTLSESDLDSE